MWSGLYWRKGCKSKHVIYSTESLTAFDLQYRVTYCMRFTVHSHFLHLIYSKKSLTACDLQYIVTYCIWFTVQSLTACDLLYRVTHCIWFTVQSHSLHLIYSKKSLIACDLQYKSKLKIKIILVAILVYMNNQYFSHISMTSQSLIGFLSLVFWFV